MTEYTFWVTWGNPSNGDGSYRGFVVRARTRREAWTYVVDDIHNALPPFYKIYRIES